MSAHIKRLLAMREEQFETAGRKFTIRRLGDLQIGLLRAKHSGNQLGFYVELVRESVIGWEMDEASLYAGGGDSKVEFDSDLFMVWVADRLDVFEAVRDRLLELLIERSAAREASRKN